MAHEAGRATSGAHRRLHRFWQGLKFQRSTNSRTLDGTVAPPQNVMRGPPGRDPRRHRASPWGPGGVLRRDSLLPAAVNCGHYQQRSLHSQTAVRVPWLSPPYAALRRGERPTRRARSRLAGPYLPHAPSAVPPPHSPRPRRLEHPRSAGQRSVAQRMRRQVGALLRFIELGDALDLPVQVLAQAR